MAKDRRQKAVCRRQAEFGILNLTFQIRDHEFRARARINGGKNFIHEATRNHTKGTRKFVGFLRVVSCGFVGRLLVRRISLLTSNPYTYCLASDFPLTVSRRRRPTALCAPLERRRDRRAPVAPLPTRGRRVWRRGARRRIQTCARRRRRASRV